MASTGETLSCYFPLDFQWCDVVQEGGQQVIKDNKEEDMGNRPFWNIILGRRPILEVKDDRDKELWEM